MNFYEELGVPQDAPLNTIREAYRNVARLLHPDAQTNPILKESAEAQMKRINQLYATLSDPERRRRYDQELNAPADHHPSAVIIQTVAPEERFDVSRGGNLAWLVATAVCAIFIVWLATRESTAPVVYSSASNTVPSKAAKTESPQTVRDDEIARLHRELAAAYADRDRIVRQFPPAGATHASPAVAIAAPTAIQPPGIVPPETPRQPERREIAISTIVKNPPSESPLRESPAKESPVRGWSGSWIYNQPRRDASTRSLLPPEFIQAVISDDNGWVHGQYHARFQVSDPTISPEVIFHFEGKISGRDGRLAWTGVDGAKGEVHLRLLSDNSLELNWSASSLGGSMGLASGTAVLDRKN